ncbi:hypothetical protein GT039_28705 [Streptomyces sp. SID2955]|nr:hypothetical protein [Streptomyces sp. SID2955]
MSRTPQPRHIILGGRVAVALTLEEYEQLMASRRQIGGQSARVRILAQQAKRTEQLLGELETLIREPAACPGHGGTAPEACPGPAPTGRTARPGEAADCLRCAVATLLRRHRDAAS